MKASIDIITRALLDDDGDYVAGRASTVQADIMVPIVRVYWSVTLIHVSLGVVKRWLVSGVGGLW